MTGPLFALLLALTLIDLAFVHTTDVVPFAELLPLWLLAATAPWLRRLQRFLLYRIAWNGGVVLVFGLLVHHATTSGLLHMLEDGLVLAVLCQVHLLNNVGDRQRPDLVFFNSFLIAFVTSFFTLDLVWSALFLAHAFVLVPALQLHAIRRGPGEALPPELVRAAVRDCVPRTAAVVALTALAFVAVPRDFRREGWLGEAIAIGARFETGLAEHIRIDDERAAPLPDNVVARITPASGQPGDVPSHWRTMAFAVFEANAWTPQDVRRFGSRFATDPAWERHPDGSLQRNLPGNTPTRVTLHLLDTHCGRLPVPLAARLVQAVAGGEVPVNPRADGSLRLLEADAAAKPRHEYVVTVAPTAGAVSLTPRTREQMLALPDDLPDVVFELAAQLRRLAPAGADNLTVATASAGWLERNRRYQLPGQQGFARNLGEFLLGSGAGHCEYFATALALILRAQQVPCRLAGGFLATEWDAAGHAVVVRGKHAHAWVEVLDEVGRWHTYDATPAADVAAATAADDGFGAALGRELAAAWAAITGFDHAARARWLEALAALPAEHPFACGSVLAALVALLYLRRRRRQVLPAIAALQRAVRAAGLSWQGGETPRELVARAALAGLEPDVLARLQTAASAHEASRYRRGPERQPR